MSYEGLLNKLCTIQAVSTAPNSVGERDETWTDVATNVKTARFAIKHAVSVGNYQVTVKDYKFSFLKTQAIVESNRILYDGLAYDVLAVFEDSRGHHKSVYAKLATLK